MEVCSSNTNTTTTLYKSRGGLSHALHQQSTEFISCVWHAACVRVYMYLLTSIYLKMWTHQWSFACLAFSLCPFIDHWESLLCKLISKAPNEPSQATECPRPHKICGVSTTGQWGTLGLEPRSTALHCYVLVDQLAIRHGPQTLQHSYLWIPSRE